METIIYGGGFNPPTVAHQQIIERCLAADVTAEVWVVPSAERADKHFGLAEADRLNMLDIVRSEVFAGNERLKISTFELTHVPRPTQTWWTLELLKQHYPDRNFRFVFGTDSYFDMPNWQQGERLQRTLGMLIIPRPDYPVPDGPNITLMPLDVECPISSTAVRELVARRQSIKHLVCSGVRDYIYSTRLYR